VELDGMDTDKQQLDPGDIGRGIMGEIWGQDFVERRKRARSDFNDAMADLAEEVCFGRIWARPGLNRRDRSMITLAMLVASNRQAQIPSYLTAALSNGCSVEEIKEILLQSALYCGIPAAAEAFRTAEGVLRESAKL
jgi:4-carboxymuconolactone decarboxylase